MRIKHLSWFAFATLFLLAKLSLANPTSLETLRSRIEIERNYVSEFKEIRSLAQKKGLRAFIFGGTATGFAVFVNTKIENGVDAGQDTTSTEIFRSSQDFDLVLTRTDGTAETKEEIESFINLLKAKFSHHYTSDGIFLWDIRGLKTMYSKKQPLTSSDYIDQNLDSMSTSLIELTDPPNHQSIVFDLKNPDSNGDLFLNDIVQKQIHLYDSILHLKTSRYLNGMNPKILSVIRLFVKAFRYGFSIAPENASAIQKIISDFNPPKSI